MVEELSMEGSSIKFGGPNGEKVLSVIAATTPASRVSSIGRRMAFCIVPTVGDAIENSRLLSSDQIIYMSRSV